MVVAVHGLLPLLAVDRDSEERGLGLSQWKSNCIIAATNNNWMFGIEPVDEVVFADKPLGAVIGAAAETVQKIFVLNLVGAQTW